LSFRSKYKKQRKSSDKRKSERERKREMERVSERILRRKTTINIHHKTQRKNNPNETDEGSERGEG